MMTSIPVERTASPPGWSLAERDGYAIGMARAPMANDIAPPKSPVVAERVYAIVGRIPPGRVTTYGAIARSVGNVLGARMVGWLLHAVPPELRLPCHRV